MISLVNTGDSDVLREATSPSTVFWSRATRDHTKLLTAAGLTLATLAVLLLMIFGEQMGLAWADPNRLAVVFSVLIVSWLIYMGWMIFKFMPGRNDRVVISLRNLVRSRIDPLDEQMRQLSDDALRAKRKEFSERLAKGETLDDIRPEAFACVREASRRARNHRQFECQLIGGRVIEGGNVAEMRTGEGKTIVCYMANYMKLVQGLHVHMVTVNDYLVKRDAAFCKPIFELLGATVGYISSEMDPYGAGAAARQQAYACDITYGTNSEFGFDYLRDNMKMDARMQVQKHLDFAVVDEVDSILIDEARTPLIISGPARDDVTNYQRADVIARSLIRRQEQANKDFARRIDEIEQSASKEQKQDAKFRDGMRKFRKDPMWLSSDEAEAIGHLQYFAVELDRKSAHMTEHGAREAQKELGIGTFYDNKNMNWPHYIDNSLKAHLCYQRDKEYVIQDDTIVIVDEFTGRLMEGRQWSDGLHQAVEAKERVTVKRETQTLATITLQNFFKLYKQLAGMTGTALTEADEFMKIYKLEVIPIPTNKPVRRIDYNDKIYKSISSKFDAIVEEIRSYSQNGYPGDPWSLYDELDQARKALEHTKDDAGRLERIKGVLGQWNDAVAASDKRKTDAEQKLEAARQALEAVYIELLGGRTGGRPLLVGTVSVESSEKLSAALTQRYGIEHEVLNAKNHAREAEIVAKAGQQHESMRGKKKMIVGNVTIATNMAGRGTDIVLGPGVADIGGLHVIGTERHESRRIDNQLRGRCGRQGDPGSSRFFLSFEDDLIKLFMGEWMLKMLNRFALEEGVPIEHKSLTNGVERAQKKVEERNFGIRKNLLEYDEVPDQQRRTFYEMRQRILEGRDLSGFIWDILDDTVAWAVGRYYDPQFPAESVAEWVAHRLGVPIEAGKLDLAEKAILFEQVRELAANEIRSAVQRTFGEYVDPTLEPDEWDLRGLVNWAASYGLNITQRQAREGDSEELMDQIVEAALRKVEQEDLTPLEEFIDRDYPRKRLIRWASEKFGVEVPFESLRHATREEAERVFRDKMREAYRRREIEYPVSAVINFSMERYGSNRNAVCDQLAKWANLKFKQGWTYEKFAGKTPDQIFEELRSVNEDYLTNGKLDAEIDAALRDNPGESAIAWARQRFGAAAQLTELTPGPDLREQLRRCGYEMLRYELTQLERMVLLNTMDAAWKDHMYAMDLLRSGIGLRGYAERDPKIEFKREGTRLFNEFLAAIRERVTDLIFKVQFGSAGGEAPAAAPPAAPAAAQALPDVPIGPPESSAYARQQATHADATNVGFASAAREQAAAAPSAAASVPNTFRRDEPRVGRNDPCPCGSGKKYKQCHGKSK